MGDHDTIGANLPRNLGRPARQAFATAGYTRLADFAGADPAELLRLHGVDPKAIRLLREDLAEVGLSLADE